MKKPQELEHGRSERALEGHTFQRVLLKNDVVVCLVGEGFQLLVNLVVMVVT